jgi:hypothetical protein
MPSYALNVNTDAEQTQSRLYNSSTDRASCIQKFSRKRRAECAKRSPITVHEKTRLLNVAAAPPASPIIRLNIGV